MKIINYISNLAIPFTILLIVSVGLIERKSVFDIFLKGAREGLEIVINIIKTTLEESAGTSVGYYYAQNGWI